MGHDNSQFDSNPSRCSEICLEWLQVAIIMKGLSGGFKWDMRIFGLRVGVFQLKIDNKKSQGYN